MTKPSGRKRKPKTAEDFYNIAFENGGVEETGRRHPGVKNPKTGRFIPIPKHGHNSKPLAPGTASSLTRSFKLEGWMLWIPFIVGAPAGALLFLLGG